MNDCVHHDYTEVERYIDNLQWSASATDNEKMLVAGNIRAYYEHMRKRALLGAADGVAVAKDIRAAFDLGQRYWQQADSDSMSQHRKSEATYEQFLAIRSKYPMPTITKAPAND